MTVGMHSIMKVGVKINQQHIIVCFRIGEPAVNSTLFMISYLRLTLLKEEKSKEHDKTYQVETVQ